MNGGMGTKMNWIGAGKCEETISHPVLFVPRQDRWNPFHVGEDLVTTFLALTLFSRQPPSSSSSASSSAAENHLWTSLSSAYSISSSSGKTSGGGGTRFDKMASDLAKELSHTANLQLIFQDDYKPTESLFAPLYDRIGAFPPRRMGADGLGACFLFLLFFWHWVSPLLYWVFLSLVPSRLFGGGEGRARVGTG
jgi:hypothetical protein